MKLLSLPPTYLFLCIVLSVVLFFALPSMSLIGFPYNLVGLIAILLGGYLNLHVTRLFERHDTPHDFEPSTCVVQEGAFRYSRHPMYLGMVLLLLGLSILLGNVVSLASPLLFFIIIEAVFIPYEENKMEQELGQEYLQYKKRVRRWL